MTGKVVDLKKWSKIVSLKEQLLSDKAELVTRLYKFSRVHV